MAKKVAPWHLCMLPGISILGDTSKGFETPRNAWFYKTKNILWDRERERESVCVFGFKRNPMRKGQRQLIIER